MTSGHSRSLGRTTTHAFGSHCACGFESSCSERIVIVYVIFRMKTLSSCSSGILVWLAFSKGKIIRYQQFNKMKISCTVCSMTSALVLVPWVAPLPPLLCLLPPPPCVLYYFHCHLLTKKRRRRAVNSEQATKQLINL